MRFLDENLGMAKIDVTTKLFRHPKCLKHKDENATPYYDAHALVIRVNGYEADVVFDGNDKYYTFIPEAEKWLRKALNKVANRNAETIFSDDSATENDTPNRFETVWEALPFEESR